jgi:hypothetical protein
MPPPGRGRWRPGSRDLPPVPARSGNQSATVAARGERARTPMQVFVPACPEAGRCNYTRRREPTPMVPVSGRKIFLVFRKLRPRRAGVKENLLPDSIGAQHSRAARLIGNSRRKASRCRQTLDCCALPSSLSTCGGGTASPRGSGSQRRSRPSATADRRAGRIPLPRERPCAARSGSSARDQPA